MAEQKFNIQIQTAAPTGPVDALTRSMGDLSRQTDRLNEMGTPEKTRATEFAFYDLDAQISRTGNTSEALPGKLNKVGKAGRDNSASLLMFSQGLEDAQYGIRGVLNNIPGLVLALGGTAGLAGGISIAAVALSQLLPLLAGTADESKDAKAAVDLLAEAIQIAGDSARDASDEEIDFAIGAIQLAADEAAKLAARWRESDEAATNYEMARLDNQEKIRVALVEFRRLQGEQIDEIGEIAKKEDMAAAKRVAVAQQELNVQEKRRLDAEEQVALAADQLEKAAKLMNTKQADLLAEREKLELLRKQRDELEKLAKAKTPDVPLSGSVQQRAGQMIDFLDRQQGAQADLGPVQMQLAQAENRIESLEAATATNGQITRRLIDAAGKLTDASLAAADVTAAVETTAAQIQETFVAEDLTGKLKAMGDVAAQAAVDIKEGVAGIQATTAEQAAAKDELLRIASDGKVTVDEQARAMAAVQALLTSNSTQTSDLLSTVQALQQTQRAQAAEIQRMKQAAERATTPGNVR